jgi:hypothetical protein
MFTIIDFSNLTKETRPIVNQAFKIWKDTYSEILSESGEKLIPEYFYRSKIMTAIYEEGLVKAFLLHNIYDLTLCGVSELSYFEPVNDILKCRLIKSEAKIFSCEWVTVHPELRARFSKVQLGDVMMGLAFKTMMDSSCDSALGFSRLDNKADKMALKFGFEKLDTIVRHGKECGVMYLSRENLKPHPYTKTQEIINELYQNKVNFSNLINSNLGAA